MRLEIEKLIYGGFGLARTGDKVVFVRGGVPGDELEVKITEEKKSFDFAEINKILQPSEYRAEPECEYFGKCGGCQWQHIDYDYQLNAKEEILRESLQRIAGIEGFKIEPFVASPNIYNYRNRVTLHTATIKTKSVLGFREEKSHELVPIDQCSISNENVSKLINRISKFLAGYDAKKLPVEKIFISDTGGVPALSLASKKNVSGSEVNSFFYKLKERIHGVDISIYNRHEKIVESKVLGLKFISSPSVFAQSNSDINEKLINTLIKWADLKKNENVLDLYCGCGNFSVHIAKKARHILGIDNDRKAIGLATKNAKLNSISNCHFLAWDVKKYLQRHRPVEKQDVIVVDPPRTGAKEIMKLIADLNPKKILYVSCNPTTLARDLKELIDCGGYDLQKLQPFDMFPQTFHIESLSLLEKA